MVGFGNSAVDIACDASRVARQVFLSTRRGAYVIPKYLRGVPVDELVTPADFRDFTFANVVRLFGKGNPNFFAGTRVAGEAAAVLDATPARQAPTTSSF